MTEPLRSVGGEPITPGVDLAGLAMRALGLGAALGSALECVVLWVTRALLATRAPSNTPDVGVAFYLVVFGTMAAMLVGAASVWGLLAPVSSPWRRTGLSAIAGFATLVTAAFAVPVDANFGPSGLLAAAAILGALALWAGLRVRSWAGEQHPA